MTEPATREEDPSLVHFDPTIRLHLPNVDKTTELVTSQPMYSSNLAWRLLVCPHSEGGATVSFGIFLHCLPRAGTANWVCFAKVEFVLLSQDADSTPLARSLYHCFKGDSDEDDWGVVNFVTLDELLNPKNNFLKDDRTACFQATVQVLHTRGLE